MVGELKALLWDLDGTLAETEELHREAFNRAFAHFGLPLFWDQETYARLLWTTGGKERLQRALEETPEAPRLSWEAIAEVHRYKTDLYLRLLREEGVALRPGVRRVLAEAREVAALLPHLGEPGNPAPVLQGPRAGERVVVDLAYLEEVRRWWST
ncbi:HAD family hydrolase [Thermus amyloliquefaciens]|uniref:HAD family hydrolase n=1 Tax=Thermus amyloliquefaciens TaxID=1449080 RepID=UPI0005712C9E|nr:HAD family hydrolase [Thermus amyloliquefaciens]